MAQTMNQALCQGAQPRSAPRARFCVRQTAGHVLCAPMDRRIPKIRLHIANVARYANQRLVVRIDSWPVNSTYGAARRRRTPHCHADRMSCG